MITYKVFVHRDFRLVFSNQNGQAVCISGQIFDDQNNPTFFDCEIDATNAVCNTNPNPRFVHENDNVVVIYDAAAAFCVNVNENAKETIPRKFICANIPSLNKIEEFVSEIFKIKAGA